MSDVRRASVVLGPRDAGRASFPPGGRVAVVRLDGAGDVLLTGPTVRAVAARADHVTFVCGPAGEEAAALLPGTDEVLVVDAPWVPLAPAAFDGRALDRTIARLRDAALDAALVLTSFHQSPLPTALLLKQAGVRLVAGTSADHPGALLDVRLRATAGHEVRRGLTLAEAAGYPSVDGEALAVSVPPRPVPPGALGAVVVHPGASAPSRAVRPQAAADLVRLLVEEGRNVVLTGSSAETAPLVHVAGRGPGSVLDLGGRTDLAALASVLAVASVLVVGNTGPAHLAAAVDTPVVSVFAPVVHHARWRPWSPSVTTLGRQDVDCAGCRAATCPFEGQPCTAEVDGAALHRAVTGWLTASAGPDAAPAVAS